MKRMNVVVAAVAVLVLAPTVPGSAAQWELTPAGWRSGPVIEHVRNLALETTAIGLDRHGKFLYVSGARSFSIYDIKQPENPQLLSHRVTPNVLNEHPDTNGKILLLSMDHGGFARVLQVWDVRDKANPTLLSVFPSGAAPGVPGGDHTWACVLDCRFAYGSQGSIVDLRDPARPTRVGDWRNSLPAAQPDDPPRRFHGIDEVAPGIVLTASQPTAALDARTDPAKPTLLAHVWPPMTTPVPNRPSIPSYAHWPARATERFALETIETPFTGPCNAGSGGLVTYDTAGYRETGAFTLADAYRITQNGTFSDGYPPANAAGCSPFGLAESPDWPEDRLVAVAWLEHGVRLLHVGLDGQIAEVGGFMAHGTEASFLAWGTRRILYVADLTRGLDVYRVAEPS
ncbi:MAG TPA: hypothetical protein VHL78_06775 [Actinomycetota bacterium]|nr:hypothetical protein [Actinomycetota bacterium]